MEPYADLSCILKVNVHCEACKMKMVEVLTSIIGVYSVNIDAREGIARISGEVDPNILVRALARSGKHAEVAWVKLKHPLLNRSYNNSDENGSYYNYNHGYGYNYDGAFEEPYRYNNRRTVPEHSWYDSRQQYYPMRRVVPAGAQYPPHYGSNYYSRGSLPYSSSLLYADEPSSYCSIM